MPGVSTYRVDSQPQGPVLGWLGLALWLQESVSRVGCVAILEGVIGQLLPLLSKYLLSARHFFGCEQTWSLATRSLQSLQGGQTIKIVIQITCDHIHECCMILRTILQLITYAGGSHIYKFSSSSPALALSVSATYSARLVSKRLLSFMSPGQNEPHCSPCPLPSFPSQLVVISPFHLPKAPHTLESSLASPFLSHPTSL